MVDTSLLNLIREVEDNLSDYSISSTLKASLLAAKKNLKDKKLFSKNMLVIEAFGKFNMDIKPLKIAGNLTGIQDLIIYHSIFKNIMQDSKLTDVDIYTMFLLSIIKNYITRNHFLNAQLCDLDSKALTDHYIKEFPLLLIGYMCENVNHDLEQIRAWLYTWQDVIKNEAAYLIPLALNKPILSRIKELQNEINSIANVDEIDAIVQFKKHHRDFIRRELNSLTQGDLIRLIGMQLSIDQSKMLSPNEKIEMTISIEREFHKEVQDIREISVLQSLYSYIEDTDNQGLSSIIEQLDFKYKELLNTEIAKLGSSINMIASLSRIYEMLTYEHLKHNDAATVIRSLRNFEEKAVLNKQEKAILMKCIAILKGSQLTEGSYMPDIQNTITQDAIMQEEAN